MAISSAALAEALIDLSVARLAESRLGASARQYLAEERHVAPEVARAFCVGLHPGKEARAALEAKGFSARDLESFPFLRPAFENWLQFPWFDAGGALGGLVFRKPPDLPGPRDRLGRSMRYAFCGDRDGLPLYGLAEALCAGYRRVIVVESTVGLLSLISAGVDACIAANSCQLRVWHARDLVANGVREIVLCLDGDDPGRRGTIKSIAACIAAGLTVRVAPLLPGGRDPEAFVADEGAEAFLDQMEDSVCGLAYAAHHVLTPRQGAGETPAARLAAAADMHALRPPGADSSALDTKFWPIVAERLGATAATISAAIAEAYARRHADRAARGLPAVAAA